MIFEKIKVLFSHGRQAIPDLRKVVLPESFRGRPEILPGLSSDIARELETVCPSGAIGSDPVSIDLGKCVFCGECARMSDHIRFTNDFRMASTSREALIVREGDKTVEFRPENIRPVIPDLFRYALKLRQVSAGGDNSTEMELNASGNVNFDLGRYGIEFVASPRHADGIVLTGPVTENMAVPLRLCYNAIPDPKVLILAGTDAISGGLFSDTPAIDRTFPERHTADLYLPGNPVHPMTYIHGVLSLVHGTDVFTEGNNRQGGPHT